MSKFFNCLHNCINNGSLYSGVYTQCDNEWRINNAALFKLSNDLKFAMYKEALRNRYKTVNYKYADDFVVALYNYLQDYNFYKNINFKHDANSLTLFY